MKHQEKTFNFLELPLGSPDDLSRTKQFFTSVFGWVFKDWGGDYADTTDSSLGCGLNADPAHRSSMPLAVIYAANLEEMLAKVLAHGGTLVRPIFSFPGGRRFHFQDPAGNELAVWSDQ